MKHLYGEFTENQIAQIKKSIRGSIFFLLLCVDPKTSNKYENINIDQCFDNLLFKLGGMNELLMNQPELVSVMSLLKAASMEYHNPDFNFSIYRKLILDAGAEVNKLKEV